MNKPLIELIREEVSTMYEKHSYYESLDDYDKLQFLDGKIDKMANVDLICLIDEALCRISKENSTDD